MELQAFHQNGRDFNPQQMISDREVSYPSYEDESLAPSLVMELEASPQHGDQLGQLFDFDFSSDIFYNEFPPSF